MKWISATLLLSIAGNVALGIAILRPRAAPLHAPETVTNDSQPAPAVANQASHVSPALGAAGAFSENRPRTLWDRLYTTDLRELVRRLHQAGFTKGEIASIASHVAYQDRSTESTRQHVEKLRNLPYWKSEQKLYADRAAEMENSSAKFQEAYSTLNELLGPNWHLDDTERDALYERRYGKLSAEKYAALAKLEADYGELRMRPAARKSQGSKAISAELKLIDAEFRKDLAAVLSEQELFEYDLRNSPGAYQLLQDTKLFAPSEAEFRALFPLYSGSAAPASEEFAAKARELLGDQRYAELLQSQDPESEKLNRIAARLNLPLSAAVEIAHVRRQAIAQAESLRADDKLDPATRQARLAELTVATETKISKTLGERGFKAYRQHEGSWFERLR